MAKQEFMEKNCSDYWLYFLECEIIISFSFMHGVCLVSCTFLYVCCQILINCSCEYVEIVSCTYLCHLWTKCALILNLQEDVFAYLSAVYTYVGLHLRQTVFGGLIFALGN